MISLADFCQERGQPIGAALEVMRVLQDEQTLRLARHQAAIDRCAGNSRPEALPMMDDGHEWARVEARIPVTAFWTLMKQKNMGYEGLTSQDGMKDILKAFPQFRVKTVSGKVQGIGFGSGPRKVVKSYN